MIAESSPFKSSSVETSVQIPSYDKKSAYIGLKSDVRDSKLNHEAGKNYLCSFSNPQSSSNKMKAYDYSVKEKQRAVKCKSASATPILSRQLSTSRNDCLGLISPCKTKRGKELLEIFPSPENCSRWWEVLLPLKRESTTEGMGSSKQHVQTNKNRLRSLELQSNEKRNSKENAQLCLNKASSRSDSKKMKDETNIKTMNKNVKSSVFC